MKSYSSFPWKRVPQKNFLTPQLTAPLLFLCISKNGGCWKSRTQAFVINPELLQLLHLILQRLQSLPKNFPDNTTIFHPNIIKNYVSFNIFQRMDKFWIARVYYILRRRGVMGSTLLRSNTERKPEMIFPFYVRCFDYKQLYTTIHNFKFTKHHKEKCYVSLISILNQDY